MRITVISAGEAGAHFTRGLVEHLDRSTPSPGSPGDTVTVVASTGDDISLWGLRLCPDLDLLVDVLSGAKGADTGVHDVADELGALGVGPTWLPVTDREMATHVARTAWLARGDSLSEVTARLVDRHGLADRGVRVLPMSDVPVEMHAVLDGPEDQQAVHVQQWRHELGRPAAARFVVAGLDRATPAPDVLDAVRGADVVLLPPADPVLGLGVVLGVPGVRDALRGTAAPVVGVSPVDGASEVPEQLAASLGTVGVAPTASGVAGLYRDLLDGWLVGPADDTPSGRWSTRTHSGPVADCTGPAAVEIAADALGLASSLRS